MTETRWYRPSVTAVRYLLGAQYLVSGTAWWIKMLPFPSIIDAAHFPQKHAVAAAMIQTGWMYHMAKIIEVLTGLALLADVFVPLMLVVSMSVAVTTFLLDAWIGQTVIDWIGGRAPFVVLRAKVLDMIYFGGAVLAMQGFLMVAYLDHYKPMLALKGRLDPTSPSKPAPVSRGLMAVYAIAALFLGVTSTFWMIGMINQWAIPWSSLSILAPPH